MDIISHIHVSARMAVPATVKVHGESGFGNFVPPEQLKSKVDPRPAHQFIIDAVKASPGEISLIPVCLSLHGRGHVYVVHSSLHGSLRSYEWTDPYLIHFRLTDRHSGHHIPAPIHPYTHTRPHTMHICATKSTHIWS